jgi:hypothetical protein
MDMVDSNVELSAVLQHVRSASTSSFLLSATPRIQFTNCIFEVSRHVGL